MLLAAGAFVSFAAAQGAKAQTADQGAAPAPGAELRQQLSNLSANPNSVDALIQAGRGALAIGDAQAALSFFSRADELAPRDARVKAGLASANARAGSPETALLLFEEAVSLGAPVAEIAGDRGLAYDMVGQPQRAQEDYVASLRGREDAEVRRRLALSLAISGQREAALRVLDPQVRGGDRSALRARVFVHALSGDTAGALAQARSSMPAGAADAMAPFLTRMAALNPGQMAAAANLGHFPSTGASTVRVGDAGRAPYQGALAFAGMPTAPAVQTAAVTPQPTPTRGTRRRPGTNAPTFASATRNAANRPVPGRAAPTPAPQPSRMAAATDAGRPSGAVLVLSGTVPAAGTSIAQAGGAQASHGRLPFLMPHPFEPFQRAAAAAPGFGGADRSSEPVTAPPIADPVRSVAQASVTEIETTDGPPPAPAAEPAAVLAAAAMPEQPPAPEPDSAPEPEPSAPEQGAAEPVSEGAAANLAVWNREAPPAPASTPTYSAPRPAAPAFSDVAASVRSLETGPQRAAPAPRPAAPRPTPARTQTARANTPTNAATTTTARAPRTATSPRIWVQLGVAARPGMAWQFSQLQDRAGRALGGRTAYVSSLGSNVRLLVGPFATDAAADTVIGQLRTSGVSAMTWTSPAGTAVEPLSGGSSSGSASTSRSTRPTATASRGTTSGSARTTTSGRSGSATTTRSGSPSATRSGASSTTRGSATASRSGAGSTRTTATNGRSGSSARGNMNERTTTASRGTTGRTGSATTTRGSQTNARSGSTASSSRTASGRATTTSTRGSTTTRASTTSTRGSSDTRGSTSSSSRRTGRR